MEVFIGKTELAFRLRISLLLLLPNFTLFFLGATAPIWALAYLQETLCFTSVF
jgi:hypothetical protein